jgi:hypothetical protein
MTDDRYRRLPVQGTRFYVSAARQRHRRSAWLKVDDTGAVLEASPAFAWACGLAIEAVERWCRSREVPLRRMHGNIRDITPYL